MYNDSSSKYLLIDICVISSKSVASLCPSLMISLILPPISVKSTIQNQINETIRHLQEQFPQATISTVSVIASDHAPQEDQIQQMESQIIEKQMDMNQSFEQKTKEYYQSILYN